MKKQLQTLTRTGCVSVARLHPRGLQPSGPVVCVCVSYLHLGSHEGPVTSDVDAGMIAVLNVAVWFVVVTVHPLVLLSRG